MKNDMCSSLPLFGLKMRLMRLRLACAEAVSKRWLDQHAPCIQPVFTMSCVEDGVNLKLRLGAHKQTRGHVLSESLRARQLCWRLPCFCPFQQGPEPVVLRTGHQLVAAAPLFEYRSCW